MRNVSGQQGENEQYWKKKRVFDTQAVDLLPDAWKLTGAMDYKAVICFPTEMSARYLIHRLYI